MTATPYRSKEDYFCQRKVRGRQVTWCNEQYSLWIMAAGSVMSRSSIVQINHSFVRH
jgi:hypothetical protein